MRAARTVSVEEALAVFHSRRSMRHPGIMDGPPLADVIGMPVGVGDYVLFSGNDLGMARGVVFEVSHGRLHIFDMKTDYMKWREPGLVVCVTRLLKEVL